MRVTLESSSEFSVCKLVSNVLDSRPIIFWLYDDAWLCSLTVMTVLKTGQRSLAWHSILLDWYLLWTNNRSLSSYLKFGCTSAKWGEGESFLTMISLIIHASSQMQEDMCLCFIDYAKAFIELEGLDLHAEDTWIICHWYWENSLFANREWIIKIKRIWHLMIYLISTVRW